MWSLLSTFQQREVVASQILVNLTDCGFSWGDRQDDGGDGAVFE
jgi:hypothetical protein